MSTANNKVKRVLVIGGGTFGKKAVQFALGESFEVFLIDSDPKCSARSLVPDDRFIREQAGTAYETVMKLAPDLIVPAAPRHMVAEWLAGQFGYQPSRQGIERCSARFPENYIDSTSPGTGIMTLSLAEKGQICPEDCPGPPDLCPLTGKAKKQPLWEIIRSAFEEGPFDLHAVLVPKPFGQSLGAFPAEEIFSLFETISRTHPESIACATASACHGVIYCGCKNR
jgi:hypothetical protein